MSHRILSNCPSGKVTWESAAKARKFIRERRNHKRGLAVYRCRFCGKWHTTSHYRRNA